MRNKLEGLLILLPGVLSAQQPLSSIEWLNQLQSPDLPGTVLLEPPVTETGRQPKVEVSPLESLPPPIGLVSARVTGLPVDLWRGSDLARVRELLATTPVRDSPAMQTLLYTLLLTEGRAPHGRNAGEEFLLARLDRLLQLGAADPARSLAQLAGPADTSARFSRWFDASLLTGDEDRSCAALIASPHLAPSYAARIFCLARRGDWQSAALTLEIAHSLELLEPGMLDLLDRFLNPDIFEGAPALPAPTSPDPLSFRLHETIGERLPTAALPRAFATADLRDIAGWKAQIEAAERLTRIGALTPNQLLGLYTERKPAASGGVWDRARAIQIFEAALLNGSEPDLISALPEAWASMQSVNLEVPFAELFTERLTEFEISDPSIADLVWRIGLLSRFHPKIGQRPPNQSEFSRYLAALSQGSPHAVTSPNETAQAIADGFQATTMHREIAALSQQQRLGEAILETMRLYQRGASGNPEALADAIAAFRLLGLEDTARQAALQLVLLDRT